MCVEDFVALRLGTKSDIQNSSTHHDADFNLKYPLYPAINAYSIRFVFRCHKDLAGLLQSSP